MAGGAAPDIDTRAQFRAGSGANAVRKKLIPIDDLLDDWHLKKTRVVLQRYDVLMKLARACEAYIAAQQLKFAKKQAARFSKPSSKLILRIAAVKQLSEQVFRRLAYDMHEYRKQHNHLGTVGVARAAGAQALQPGYRHEKTVFEAAKVQQNLAGITGQAGYINPYGGTYAHKMQQDVLHKAADAQRFEMNQNVVIPANILALGQVPFGNLTSLQYMQLHQFFTPVSDNQYMIGGDPKVHYYRKDERLQELIRIPVSGTLHDPDGTVHSSRILRGGAVVAEAWVMDEYGNILTKDFIRAADILDNGLRVMFNHSSLAAGNRVLCAGMIGIRDGKVVSVSNESGHYQPTARQLSNAILVMKEELDLDVENTLAEVTELASNTTYPSLTLFWAAHPHD